MSAPDAPVSFGMRLRALAQERPADAAVTFLPVDGDRRELSWLDLERASNRVARLLAADGVDDASTVVIGLPNSPEHIVCTLAAWKLGALALPLNHGMAVPERRALLDLATPRVVVSDWPGVEGVRGCQAIDPAACPDLSDEPLPDRVPHPGKAIASGGSTGRPKIIVDPNPLAYPVGLLEATVRMWAGIGADEVQAVAGPLYHNLPFAWTHLGLFLGHRLVLFERFDAAAVVDAVEREGVTFMPLVPTMMRRILDLPGVGNRDLSSLRSVFHTAAPCPANVKRGWIDLVGPGRVYEVFAATEAAGSCVIRGDEWLAHPGSVGKPTPDTELVVLDDDLHPVGPRQVGEIFMRRGSGRTYDYVGAPEARTAPDGYTSVGDLGWVDEDGYLYVADRRADLIISGGANVYPAEVEMALAEHPGVADCAVVGLPDEVWGKTVHAIVEAANPASPPPIDELERHCKAMLSRYKVPKSWAFVERLPRDEAGKIRRSALVPVT